MREFIEGVCVTGEDKWASSKALYLSYKRYSGDDSISGNAFGRRLAAMGFEKKKRHDVWGRLGIELLEPPFWRRSRAGAAADGRPAPPPAALEQMPPDADARRRDCQTPLG